MSGDSGGFHGREEPHDGQGGEGIQGMSSRSIRQPSTKISKEMGATASDGRTRRTCPASNQKGNAHFWCVRSPRGCMQG